jgi:hypothetical protein
VAPEPGSADQAESGLWLCDAGTGTTQKIVSLMQGQVCIHPQWSPFCNEILFAVVPEDSDGDVIPYSIWKVLPDGTGLEMIAESTTPEGEDDAHPFLLPNAVMWGALPGTIVFQKAAGARVMPMLFDPYTGDLRPFLPEAARAYSLQPSPCRRWVAGVIYNECGTARVLLSDFGICNWRVMADLQIDPEHLRRSSPVVFWSPDSTRFAVAEMEGEGHYLRVFEVPEGTTRRVARAIIRGPILWDRDGESILFAGSASKDDAAAAGVFRVHVEMRQMVQMIRAEDASLLGWSAVQDRLLFTGQVRTERDPLRRFFSSSAVGSDLALLPVESGADGDPAGSVSPDGTALALIGETGPVRFLALR